MKVTSFLGAMLSDTRKDDSVRDYKIKDSTHLIKVSDAISEFPDAIVKIKGTEADKQIDTELMKLPKKYGTNDLIRSLCWYEKHNKKQLYKILDSNVIEIANSHGYLENRIHNREDAAKIAIALSVIDDYMDYLETDDYNGPVTRL